MKTVIKLMLAVLLLSLPTEGYSDAKKLWKQKMERYEKAKQEAQERGETFDPNKWVEQDANRKRENPLPGILCILGGFAVLVGVIIFMGDVKEKSPGVFWLVLIIGALIILFFIAKSCGLNMSSGRDDYYNSDDEYWEKVHKHTYIQKPSLNNVNTLIFNSLELFI